MTERVFIASTWSIGGSYINLEVEFLAGGFVFDLGVVHCHHLVRRERRQGVSLFNLGRRGSLSAVSA